MDGENNGSKPYEQMDDFGGFSLFFFGSTPTSIHIKQLHTNQIWYGFFMDPALKVPEGDLPT